MRKIVGLIAMCGFVAVVGCGDNGGGGGVDARRDGIVLGDGGGGEGGVDAMGDAGRPDAGMPVGTRLSMLSGYYLQVSQNGQYVVFAEEQSKVAHVVPTTPANPLNEVQLGGSFVVDFQGNAFWVNNTVLIEHDLNATVPGAAVWRQGMTAADDLHPILLGTGTSARPFARVSTDGLKVAYLDTAATANQLDLKMKDYTMPTAPTLTTIVAGIPSGTGCGFAGAWASPTVFVLLSCNNSPVSMQTQLFKVDVTAPTAPVKTLLSDGTEAVQGLVLSTTDNRIPDGGFVAYYTSGIGAMKIVNLAGAPNRLTVETSGVAPPANATPLGLFHGTDLFYINGGQMKKATVTTPSPAVVLVSSGVPYWAYSSISGSAFSDNGSRAMFFKSSASMGQFGNMGLVSTTDTPPLTVKDLNSDNNGYPGDDAYSGGSTYVFWYDGVLQGTNGIGMIHSRRFDAPSGDPGRVVGPNGYFIRATRDDNIAAVMANTTGVQDQTHLGDLWKVDLRDGSHAQIVDQITYVDMLYETDGTHAVYSRLDGIFKTPPGSF